MKSLQCSLVQQFQHAQGSPWNQMGLDKAPNPLRILHNFLASSISEFNLWISWHNLWYKACMASTCSAVWARYRTWTYWQKGKIAMSVGMNKNYDVADLGSTGVARIICINHHQGKCRHWRRQIIWRRFFFEQKGWEVTCFLHPQNFSWHPNVRIWKNLRALDTKTLKKDICEVQLSATFDTKIGQPLSASNRETETDCN